MNTQIKKQDRTRENFYREAQIEFMKMKRITNLEMISLNLQEKRALQIEFDKWCESITAA